MLSIAAWISLLGLALGRTNACRGKGARAAVHGVLNLALLLCPCRRFNYAPKFLRWALQPPGYLQDWHLGVRVKVGIVHHGTASILVVPLRLRPRPCRRRAYRNDVIAQQILCIFYPLPAGPQASGTLVCFASAFPASTRAGHG